MFLLPVKLFFFHMGWKTRLSSPLRRVCVGIDGFAPVVVGVFWGRAIPFEATVRGKRQLHRLPEASNLYVTILTMLGETVRSTRIKRGLTQAHLARLAGVSRRHLAALEKGANVSILVLRKVASVLELEEIHLGELTLQTASPSGSGPVNMPLLADTIREAHADAFRAQSLLARAETILDHGDSHKHGAGMVAHFPKMLPQPIDMRRRRRSAGSVADKGGPAGIPIAGEIRQGEAVTELAGETSPLPSSVVGKGEVVFRARGEKMRDQGIEDGDLLVVELRQTGRAASGELVIGKVGELLYVGHWWQKHGQKAIMTDGPAELTTGGTSKRALKVLAAINAIVRPK
jgi:HTH-type transcriptional regulator/antitoxin HipB